MPFAIVFPPKIGPLFFPWSFSCVQSELSLPYTWSDSNMYLMESNKQQDQPTARTEPEIKQAQFSHDNCLNITASEA